MDGREYQITRGEVSMPSKRLQVMPSKGRQQQSTAVLKTVLETPNLPLVIARMQSVALVSLVQHVGIEDCGELLPYFTSKQLASVLDEELWHAKRVGETESFSVKQAIRWLTVWNDLGPEYICRTLPGLGKNFLAALLLQFAHVHELTGLAWELLDIDGYGSTMQERDNPFRHIFKNYNLVARRRDHEQWELMKNMLTCLWENEPDFLLETLALCCNRAHQDEHDDEGLGREKVAEVEELLHDELAYDRETRRQALGYIAPEKARELLMRVRGGENLAPLRDFFITTAILNDVRESIDESEEQTEIPTEEETTNAYANADSTTTGEPDDLGATVRTLEAVLLSNIAPKPLSLALPEGDDEATDTLHTLLARTLIESDIKGSTQLQGDIAGLCNLLMSGCNLINRRFEREEVRDAVLAVTELGLVRRSTKRLEFPEQGFMGAFQAGLMRLHNEVTLPLATILDELVRSRKSDHRLLREAWVDVGLKRGSGSTSFVRVVKEQKFFELAYLLKGIEPVLGKSLAFQLKCLLSEFPVLPMSLTGSKYLDNSSRLWLYINDQEKIGFAARFTSELPDRI
jgi:hypothetical protein